MVKTAAEIVNDVYARLKNSDLAEALSGVVCFEGFRPIDSRLEDAIVIFTSGDAEQVQEGNVTINIYVPDHKSGDLYRKNKERCDEVEKLAGVWVEQLIDQSNDYLFSQNGAITTNSEEKINQHFVVVKLKYKIVTV